MLHIMIVTGSLEKLQAINTQYYLLLVLLLLHWGNSTDVSFQLNNNRLSSIPIFFSSAFPIKYYLFDTLILFTIWVNCWHIACFLSPFFSLQSEHVLCRIVLQYVLFKWYLANAIVVGDVVCDIKETNMRTSLSLKSWRSVFDLPLPNAKL